MPIPKKYQFKPTTEEPYGWLSPGLRESLDLVINGGQLPQVTISPTKGEMKASKQKKEEAKQRAAEKEAFMGNTKKRSTPENVLKTVFTTLLGDPPKDYDDTFVLNDDATINYEAVGKAAASPVTKDQAVKNALWYKAIGIDPTEVDDVYYDPVTYTTPVLGVHPGLEPEAIKLGEFAEDSVYRQNWIPIELEMPNSLYYFKKRIEKDPRVTPVQAMRLFETRVGSLDNHFASKTNDGWAYTSPFSIYVGPEEWVHYPYEVPLTLTHEAAHRLHALKLSNPFRTKKGIGLYSDIPINDYLNHALSLYHFLGKPIHKYTPFVNTEELKASASALKSSMGWDSPDSLFTPERLQQIITNPRESYMNGLTNYYPYVYDLEDVVPYIEDWDKFTDFVNSAYSKGGKLKK